MLEPGGDPTHCSLRISSGVPLPSVCYECGRHADRGFSVIRRSNEGRDETSSAAVGVIGAFFSWWFALYLLLRRRWEQSEVEVGIPVCWEHAEGEAPSPRYVDFKNFKMTFIVHTALRDAVRREG
jgi:hypothetical protein